MSDLRIGELFAGYGGLGMGVKEAIGGEVAWVSDVDPGANLILEHRFPGVPNLGDITTVTWSDVEPVDIMTAGFPCQPVSKAGKRKGTGDGRWLFDEILRAIGELRAPPRLLLLENVPGLLTANGGDAMARVVLGLARVGYVGTYRIVSAKEVDAPHQRERIFIAACPADAGSERHGARQDPGAVGRLGRWLEGKASQRQRTRPLAVDRSPATVAADAGRPGLQGMSDGAGDTWSVVAGSDQGTFDWRAYSDAIHRWETALGRRAPVPAVDGRENPRFVEWMMGLPDGWVTDVPGISWSQALKALGNGVVPAQAARAVRLLMDHACIRPMAA